MGKCRRYLLADYAHRGCAMTTFQMLVVIQAAEEFRERLGHAPSAGAATGSNPDFGEDQRTDPAHLPTALGISDNLTGRLILSQTLI